MRLLMNKQKTICWPKIACLLMGIVALGLITACTDKLVTEENNPKRAWETFFGYVSDGDFVSAFDMTGSRLKVSSTDLDGELERCFLGKLSETCSYRFVSDTDAKGVKAWQQVEITTLDMRKLAVKVIPAVLQQTEAQIWEHGSYKTDEALMQGLNAALLDQLSEDCSDCLTMQRVKVEFHYKDGQWRPIMDAALYDAISGYAAHADQSVENAVKEYAAQRQNETEAVENN